MNTARLLISAALCAHISLGGGKQVWKAAAPPPASWQRDRLADLASRRRAAAARIGEKGILILWAAEPRNYAGDTDWPYRQENDFFYLTGISQAGCIFVLVPSGATIHEILFLPPSNPAQERWTGHLLTPAEGRAVSGIDQIWDTRQFPEFLTTLFPATKAVLEALPAEPPSSRGSTAGPVAPLPVNPKQEFARAIQLGAAGEAGLYVMSHGSDAEFRRERAFAGKLAAADPGLTLEDPAPLLNQLRTIKSPREIELLEHAIDITREAFERVFAVTAPEVGESEIQAQFEFTFLRRNAHWGYPCIVGSGVNATTLHYETNRGTMHAGDLLLMDSGAEFDGYSADITRTIPVNARFSPEQAEIYRLVWAAQQAGIAQAKPGHQAAGGDDTILGAAVKVFKDGLLRLGLITDPKGSQYAIWFSHGISHGIGLNVHDPGARELAPGMVVTVEPGLYFRPDALDNLPKTPENQKFIAGVRPAFERYKGIGVRIEDDVLVTAGEPRVLSAAIPSKLDDVEAAIVRLRKAVKTNPLP